MCQVCKKLLRATDDNFVKCSDCKARVHLACDKRADDFFQGSAPGLTVLPLHAAEGENVALVRWASGTKFTSHSHWGGEEIFVIEGTFQDEHGDYPAGSWIRSPHMSRHTPWSDEGCLIYVKTGSGSSGMR